MKLLCGAIAGCFLISCAQVKSLQEATSRSVAGLVSGEERIPIVEPRRGDMKDLKTGQEKALAFEKSGKARFWAFRGPVHFQEPDLPTGAGLNDGELLPPKLH